MFCVFLSLLQIDIFVQVLQVDGGNWERSSSKMLKQKDRLYNWICKFASQKKVGMLLLCHIFTAFFLWVLYVVKVFIPFLSPFSALDLWDCSRKIWLSISWFNFPLGDYMLLARISFLFLLVLICLHVRFICYSTWCLVLDFYRSLWLKSVHFSLS